MSISKLSQRLVDLSQRLTRKDLSEEERDNIEAKIYDIEEQLAAEYNQHSDDEDY